MALYGGVIVIGVDETDGVASSLTPIPLAGAPEQVEQVIASRVTPPVTVQLDVLRENEGDADGLIVIEVPASTSAPHQADGRYPARAGSTTRSLTEVEVQQWYERRRELQADLSREGIGGFVLPAGAVSSSWGAIGRMRLVIHAPGAAQHPEAPRLADALKRAFESARTRAREILRDELVDPDSIAFLEGWTPRGSLGWGAGIAASDYEQARRGVLVGATLPYAGNFSVQTTMGLEVGGAGRCAFEHLWVRELIAQLLLAGAFLREVPGAGIARIDLELFGLENAASYEATKGRTMEVSRESVVADSTYGSDTLEPVATRGRPAPCRARAP